MRYLHSVVAVAAVLAAVSACADDPTASNDSTPRPQFAVAAAPEQVMPGEVLARPVAGADIAAIASAHGLTVAERGYAGKFYVLRGAVGAEHANARALKADRRVVWAEPNYLRQPTTINPNLWAFYNPGSLNMKFTTGRSKGQFLPSSYASFADADEDDSPENFASAASNDVVIGSIDTGVDFTHPEFNGAGEAKLVAGKDWYSNDDDPTDDNGHGTHTTGTMAGKTVGVAGVAGAAAHVTVYVQRVCGRRGCPTSAIIDAINAAADVPGMVAMNLSLGGSSESQGEKDAIAYATSKDVLVIASAGNSGGSSVECPACDPNAIAVAASTWQDKLASYSNHGAGLDIAAPGGYCYSNTTPEGCIYSAYKGGGYAWLMGTSMAAPQVTGTAAVVAATSNKRGSALRSQLLGTADQISGQDFAAGRLNTYRAVTNQNP